MKSLFVHYPKCSTCRRAAKWLSDNAVEVVSRDIVKENPTKGELSEL